WQSFVMVAAHAKGYSYRSTPVLFERRRQGMSFLDGAAPVVALKTLAVDLPRAVWEYRARRRFGDPADRFLQGRDAATRPQPRRLARKIAWRSYMAVFPATHWLLS